jgi:diketogulonate reductase-like aldo/keto reductase
MLSFENHQPSMPVAVPTLMIDGVNVPRFLYGTAWKEEETERLAALAVRQGFRGIDTANQRRHYHEAAVGRALAGAIAEGIVQRGDLFLQTKFTFRPGQDHRLPYDPSAPIPTQVEQSFTSSLAHLGVDMIDSYLLHGPIQRAGLSADDWAAWRAMEAIHDNGQTRLLGISNVSLEQLQLLVATAHVRPRFVQNRCFARTGWDRRVREYCRVHGIVYEGFSLLTANRDALAQPALVRIAGRYDRTAAQVIFRFALDVGMIAITGTSSAQHMADDLSIFDFQLRPEEVEQIENIAGSARGN